MSDDGSAAIVVIALLGNPFSPGYARARAKGPADALAFSSMNVAIYARGASGWALHERPVKPQDRAPDGVAIGASTMRWDGDRLVVDLDEHATPFGRRLRGRVVLEPEVITGARHPIDVRGEHHWWPIAPLARISVDLTEPALRFRGHGYHDANAGDVPIPTTFERWSWARARTPDGAVLTYDVALASGDERALAFRVSPRGRIEDFGATWKAPLPRTTWGLDRHVRVDANASARVVRSLEDGPFYARALVATRLGGRPEIVMHEELAAHRLRSLWVRSLIRFRMRGAW